MPTGNMSPLITQFMARAIQLAEQGHYSTKPNPRVGCVIVKNEQIIAEGWHQFAGQGHAEINALSNLDNPSDAKGATAYVTLEPCSHQGKTGPCCDALIQAGVAEVVFGTQDPNPQVSGQGLEKLRQAGIQVTGPVLENECRSLNPGFIKRMQEGLPLVRCKLAMSLDGRTAMASGESQWITGPEAREDVQKLRAQSCAIITGSGTVKHDNPSLTVRSEQLPANSKQKQPLRVILGKNSDADSDKNIFKQEGETLCFTERQSLKSILQYLATWQCNEVLIEAGPTLAGAFAAEGLIDELIVYMAPCLMGSEAKPLLELPLQSMADKVTLTIQDIRAVGNDWRITAVPNTPLTSSKG